MVYFPSAKMILSRTVLTMDHRPSTIDDGPWSKELAYPANSIVYPQSFAGEVSPMNDYFTPRPGLFGRTP
jgi:hypothetical protein